LLPTFLFLISKQPLNFSLISFFGLFVWVSGFLIETIADHQKFTFLKYRTGMWIDQGLWSYSRHPNYFGEILCWVGLYLYATIALSATEIIICFFASPVFLTCLLLFISGIPLLEKEADLRWGHETEYQQYKRQTSVLIPWFRRR
jgi:steroid 5-alpha reductase family enzyme